MVRKKKYRRPIVSVNTGPVRLAKCQQLYNLSVLTYLIRSINENNRYGSEEGEMICPCQRPFRSFPVITDLCDINNHDTVFQLQAWD